MDLLIDTNVLIWSGLEPSRLSAQARDLLSGNDEAFVSLVSAWEMQVKHALGKLYLPEGADSIYTKFGQEQGFSPLPISLNHIGSLYRLPQIHRDPFDRLLAAQALAEGLTILSPDPIFAHYPVSVIW